MAELTQWRRLPELRWINDYHVDEGWLDALEASVENYWDLHGRGEKLLDAGQVVAGNLKICDALQKAIVQSGYASAFD